MGERGGEREGRKTSGKHGTSTNSNKGHLLVGVAVLTTLSAARVMNWRKPRMFPRCSKYVGMGNKFLLVFAVQM